MKKLYTYKKDSFNTAVFSLMTYYKVLNFNLYEAPQIDNSKLKKLYDNSTELLGTVFNTNTEYYGLFYEVEKHFGALGSFYDFVPKSGTYSMQLPSSYVLIKIAVEKAIKWLKNTKDFTLIVWFPMHFTQTEKMSVDALPSLEIQTDLLPIFEESEYLKETYKHKTKNLLGSYYNYKVLVLSS